MGGPGQESVAVNQTSEAENSSTNIRNASTLLSKLLVDREVTPPREYIEQKRIAEAVFEANEQAIDSAKKKEQANQKLDASVRFHFAKYYIDTALATIKPTALTGEQTSSNLQMDPKQRYLLAASLANTMDVIIKADELGADYQPLLNEWLKVPESEKYLSQEKGVTKDGKKLLVENNLSRPNNPMFGQVRNILGEASWENKKQGLSTEQPGQRFSPYPSSPPRSESVSRGSEGSSHVPQQNNVEKPIRGRKGR